MTIRPEDALEYHSTAPAGKISVTPTKPCRTQRDLSLAYTPGVAVPCGNLAGDVRPKGAVGIGNRPCPRWTRRS